MRDDLTASEKRLIAALDRLDQFIDRAAEPRHIAPGPASGPGADAEDHAGLAAQLTAARGENQRLSGELVLLHERQGVLLSNCETRLAEANDRLLAAGQEAARLAAANEALADANRALIAGAGDPGDEARQALEAEIESLRATRDAEIAQMGDLLGALDRMIGATAPEASEDAARPRAAAPAAARKAPAAAVLEMPMPEQVTAFAGAAQNEAEADAGDDTAQTTGQTEERG